MTTLAAARRVKIATFRIHAFPRLYNTLQDRSRVDWFFNFPFQDQSIFQRSCPFAVLLSSLLDQNQYVSTGEREARIKVWCLQIPRVARPSMPPSLLPLE
jgi:hypothetical protein